MTRLERIVRAARLMRSLARAEAKVAATSAARARLPGGSSRARVTTANARWSIACEARDRIERELLDLGVDTNAREVVLTAKRAVYAGQLVTSADVGARA